MQFYKQEDDHFVLKSNSDPKDSQNIQQQNLYNYKKSLLFKVILLLIILFLFVLERIFYWYIEEFELSLIKKVQSQLNLSYQSDSKHMFQIGNAFSLQQYYLIFFTHFYITLYTGIDGILSLKIMTMHYIGIYLIEIIVFFYRGARPYWLDQNIISYSCFETYSHPSIFTFSMLFWLFYSYDCYKKNQNQITLIQIHDISVQNTTYKIIQLIQAIFVLVFLFFVALDYISGNMFIINIVLSFCLFILYYLLVFQIDNQVNNLIKKFTIMKLEAKKNIFYWLLFVIIAQLLSLIIYLNNSEITDIKSIKNYIQCMKKNDKLFQFDEYKKSNNLIGPYQQFQSNFILIALVGAIFGSALTFNKLVTVHWFRGSLKFKLLRILISNIFVIPLWLIYTLPENELLDNVDLKWFGFDRNIINSLIYFFSYYFLFGIMPAYVFPKLKLTIIGFNQFSSFQSQQ